MTEQPSKMPPPTQDSMGGISALEVTRSQKGDTSTEKLDTNAKTAEETRDSIKNFIKLDASGGAPGSKNTGSASGEKLIKEGVISKTENPEGKDASLGKSETEYEKQMNTLQTRGGEIMREAGELKGELEGLHKKVEQLEQEGKKNSEEAKKVLDGIAQSTVEGPQNQHTKALNDTIKNLPDKLTTKDVENLKERAQWDAAKASVGDKDFGNMTQIEKDVVLERVKKMKENATPNPESAIWGAAKKTSGLSPDIKWAEMSTAEQKLVQERFTDAKAKAQNKDANKSDTPAPAPAPAPVPAKTPVENKPSAPAPASAPDTKKPDTPTVIDKAIGFDQIQGKKHGHHTELDKKLSDGSMVSVYNRDGARSINIGKNLRFAEDNAYDAAIKITLKNDGSVDEIVDTRNFDAITGSRRTNILAELKKIGLTLPS